MNTNSAAPAGGRRDDRVRALLLGVAASWVLLPTLYLAPNVNLGWYVWWLPIGLYAIGILSLLRVGHRRSLDGAVRAQ